MANPQVLETYGKLPLSFEANEGQTDRQVKFLSRGSGYSLFLTSNEAVLSLRKTAAPAAQRRMDTVAMQQEVAENKAITSTVLRMRLVGANPAAEITGIEELPGKSNYFIGNDPKEWRTNVPTYAKVKYREVYPGVDLVYYGNQRRLEHDFVVAPGTDPRRIRLSIEGAQKVSLSAQGDLMLQAAGGEVRLKKPALYQEEAGTRRDVGGGYVLVGNNEVGFEVGAYDPNRLLVIDPTLAYSTYLGGSGSDFGNGIAVDSAGSAYVTGTTLSTNFPTTGGAFQTAAGTNEDAFVTKLNAAGSERVYSTYLGGPDNDEGHGIAVDSAGSAYVTGRAEFNFPTTPGAFQTTCPGTSAFVTKLNAAGSAPVYSTCLGGGNSDVGNGIAVDSTGSAYVTGFTGGDFPTTPGAFRTTFGGGSGLFPTDAFVIKLNAAGSAPVYSTYLGGSDNDFGQGIAVDSAGNAYVTGRTNSSNFPTTSGAFQATGGGTCGNPGSTFPCAPAFVTKLNAAGSAPVYSTYLGGNGDEGHAIAVDSAGNAYVTGSTSSGNLGPTPGAFQTTPQGSNDAFVIKLNAAGSAPVYSTYLGGNDFDLGKGIAVDSAGSAYVTGVTASTNFPLKDAFQTTFPGGASAFVTKLNAAGSGLVYSSYSGGSAVCPNAGCPDQGNGIAVDSAGSAYVTGYTGGNFPTTSGAFQTTFGGGTSDAFVTKITDCSSQGDDVEGDGDEQGDDGHVGHFHFCKGSGEMEFEERDTGKGMKGRMDAVTISGNQALIIGRGTLLNGTRLYYAAVVVGNAPVIRANHFAIGWITLTGSSFHTSGPLIAGHIVVLKKRSSREEE